jgi:hypothetical protein
MPGYNTQRWDAARTSPRHGDFTKVTDFRREPKLRYGQSGYESQKNVQPKLCLLLKVHSLLSIGPHFVHVEVSDRDGNSLWLAQYHLMIKVTVTVPLWLLNLVWGAPLVLGTARVSFLTAVGISFNTTYKLRLSTLIQGLVPW